MIITLLKHYKNIVVITSTCLLGTQHKEYCYPSSYVGVPTGWRHQVTSKLQKTIVSISEGEQSHNTTINAR